MYFQVPNLPTPSLPGKSTPNPEELPKNALAEAQVTSNTATCQDPTASATDQESTASPQKDDGGNPVKQAEYEFESGAETDNREQHSQPPPDDRAVDYAEEPETDNDQEEYHNDEQKEDLQLMEEEASPFAGMFDNVPRISLAASMMHRRLTGSNLLPPRATGMQAMFHFQCMEMFLSMRQGQGSSISEGNSRKRTRSPSPPPGSEDEQCSSFTPIQVKQEGSKRNKLSGRLAQCSSQKGMDSKTLSLCREGAAIPSTHLAFKRAVGQPQTLGRARAPSPLTIS